jgi:hypothetical protein
MQKINILEINGVLSIEKNIFMCEGMKYSIDVQIVTG